MELFYDSISKLIERGQIADPITLNNSFEQEGILNKLGGQQYLVEIASSMVNVINAADYGRNIYDLHIKRQLIDLGEQVINRAHTADVDDLATYQIENAEQKLYALSDTGETRSGFQPFKNSIVAAIDMLRLHIREMED